MLRHEKLSINEAKSVSEVFLSGICKCGKYFSAYAEIPSLIEVSDGVSTFKVEIGEHLVFVCPFCNRLVNLGNGSRRKKGDLKQGAY